MTFEQLTEELKRRYESANKGDQMLAIHLFGIEFAHELEGHSVREIAKDATGHESHEINIGYGKRLSEHVVLKRQPE